MRSARLPVVKALSDRDFSVDRTDARGYVQFNQLLPGAYLFEATTPSLDVIGATPAHVAVTARGGEVVDAKLRLPTLADAAATVCGVRSLDRGTAILAGVVSLGASLVDHARVTVEWPDGEQHADTRQDGSYRLCGVPTGTLLMIKASRDNALAWSSRKASTTAFSVGNVAPSASPVDLNLTNSRCLQAQRASTYFGPRHAVFVSSPQ